MNVKIISSDLDVGQVMEKVAPGGHCSFTVKYEYRGRAEERKITVMKYNENGDKRIPPHWVRVVFPERPEEITVPYPATYSNLFAQFPNGNIESDDGLKKFLVENYIVKG